MRNTFLKARLARALLLAGALLAAGCVDPEGVQTYAVAKNPAGVAWFFKMQGSEEQVAAHAAEFAKLVGTLSFGAGGSGRPTWELPEGWTQELGNGLRFATLKVEGTEPPLEVSVIALDAPDPTSDEYLLENINRWRGQLSIEPYSEANWKELAEAYGDLTQVQSQGRTVTVVDLNGLILDGEEEVPQRMLAAVVPQVGVTLASLTAPPPAQAGPPPAMGNVPQGAATGLPITFDLPEGWTEGTAGMMQDALFTAGEGAVEISISRAGGTPAANIQRWQNQVQIPAGTDFADNIRGIEVDGQVGAEVLLAGPERSILGAMVQQPTQPTLLFLKMIGPNAAVAAERERFSAFLESVKFAP